MAARDLESAFISNGLEAVAMAADGRDSRYVAPSARTDDQGNFTMKKVPEGAAVRVTNADSSVFPASFDFSRYAAQRPTARL